MSATLAQFAAPPPSTPPQPGAPPPPPITPYVPPVPTPPADTPRLASDEDFGNRTLTGHTFLYPAYFDSAFVATYIGVRAELRFLHVPDVATQFGSFKLNLTGASESFDFGLKLTDIVGLRVTGAVRAIVGTNIPSVVYEGATYDLGAGLQVPIRLFRLESSGSQLALVPYFSFSSGQATTIFPLLRNGAGATLATFLVGNGGELAATPFDAVRFGLNAAFAQTFSPNFSLQAGAGLGRTVVTIKPFVPPVGDRQSDTEGAWAFNIAASFTADAAPNGFPLAGMFEWRTTRQPESTSLIVAQGSDTTHVLALGAYYSGRRDLQFGVVGALELGLGGVPTDTGTSGSPNAKDLGMILRYFW